jgi:hypothetical protein
MKVPPASQPDRADHNGTPRRGARPKAAAVEAPETDPGTPVDGETGLVDGANVPPVPPVSPAKRAMNTGTVELLTGALFRTIFGKGIQVPIKMSGVLDMDVLVRDNDVFVNANQVLVELPQLSIWRLVVAYQGRPVVELGRGVRKKIHFHYGALLFAVLRIWRDKRRAAAAFALKEQAKDRAALVESRSSSRKAAGKEAT